MTNLQASDPWFLRPQPNPQATVRLFCFPYAGGGAGIFRTWSQELPAEIEVCLVQLPGRESRIRESALTRLDILIQQLSPAILPLLDIPFAFFGYSMGALIGFELARQLRQQNGLIPSHLFLAACRGVHIPTTHPIHQLSDSQFVAEINQRYQGIPLSVLQNPELLQIVVPVLKADFAILDTYIFQPDVPLPCPFTAFGGFEDPIVSQENLLAWRDHTSNTFSLEMVPGDHFFLNQSRSQLLNTIVQRLGYPIEIKC